METTLTYKEKTMLTDVVIVAKQLYKIDSSFAVPNLTAEGYVNKVFDLCKIDKKELAGVFDQAVEDLKLSCNF